MNVYPSSGRGAEIDSVNIDILFSNIKNGILIIYIDVNAYLVLLIFGPAPYITDVIDFYS